MAVSLAPIEKYQLLDEASSVVDEDPSPAIGKLQDLLDAGEQDQKLQVLYARALINLERNLEAAEFAKKALDQNEASQEAFALWLHALSHAGDYAGQEAAVEFGMSQARMEYRNLLLMAQACRFLGKSGDAVKLYELLIGNRPDDATLYSKLGLVYQGIGELDRAEKCFRSAIEKDRMAAQNYYLLSCVKRQTAQHNNIPQLREAWKLAQEAHENDPQNLSQLAYALGKEHEDLEDFDNAFGWYEKGAGAARSVISHSVHSEKSLYERIKAFHRQLEKLDLDGYEGEEPIFIVGMPRTGSTLIDTILSRHSRIYAAGELNSFSEALKEQSGFKGGGDVLAQVFSGETGPVDFMMLGRRYVALARTSMSAGQRFTDKMPKNHVLLGLIALALPRARFICTGRNLPDVCMSNFKQYFLPGSYPYSYSLEETAQHCLVHQDLTEFWTRQLSGRVLTVNYEEMVTDTESTVRTVLDFCGLDWEQDCLNFQSSRASVTTASSAQVRQPIYRSSLGRWRNYEKQLQPALIMLQKGGVRITQSS
jgi:tetratricopeptide (TPR) repeat protein